MADEKSCEVTAETWGKSKTALTIDVSLETAGVIKNLKAIQREARNATIALRELEHETENRIIDHKEIIDQDLSNHAQAISEWLKQNSNPHTKIEITDSGVKLITDEFFIPITGGC